MKYSKVYFLVSATMIAVVVYGLAVWGLKFGVDFLGGSIVEYKFDQPISNEIVIQSSEEAGIEITSIQTTGENTYFIKLPALGQEEKLKLEEVLFAQSENPPEELRYETVGPTIGPELVKKTFYAIGVAALAILIWIAYQFKSIRFGTSAVLAMFHDSFILVGSFSLLGHFFGAEIDFLFATALLTTLSFSVHDTIVVYDRIRESQRKQGGDLRDLANKAISETMVRSLNNSFTIIFMLVALVLLGGITIRWFAVALFIGTVLGTYSSPFVAVPLLAVWSEKLTTFKLKTLFRKA